MVSESQRIGLEKLRDDIQIKKARAFDYIHLVVGNPESFGYKSFADIDRYTTQIRSEIEAMITEFEKDNTNI